METNSDKVMDMCLRALDGEGDVTAALREAVNTMEVTARQRKFFLEIMAESDKYRDKRLEACERSLQVYDRKQHADYWLLYPPAPKEEKTAE